jgi:hypothetical protein
MWISIRNATFFRVAARVFAVGVFLQGRFVLHHGQVAVIYIFLRKIVKNQRL